MNLWINAKHIRPICENYARITTKADVINFIISKAIVVSNILIRLIVILILEKTGSKTESKMTFNISLSVFFFTFMNTGILLLLSNANLKSQGINILDKGTYSDFNTNWYLLTGDILVQTMILNSFTPMITIIVNILKFKILDAWDQF